MKTSRCVIGITIALACVAARGAETPLSVVPDPGQTSTFMCNDPEIAASVAAIRQSKDPDWPKKDIALQQKGECVGQPRGDHFIVLSETTASGGDVVDQVQNLSAQSPNLYVLKRNLSPITAEETKDEADRACGAGFGGEVDRWVLSKDGTPKLKRFMITSRCVNGQMRSFSKPLN